ncbi:hypothetical protein CP556_06145 [Natrinema sp. CBA1119]|uniref:group I intron-associated PD-(D/E)XK endonuclease n=1 Tax=Natrinema sp. CBA1119 TaxID=1608465 RepID=UPI000BF6DEBE|nr:hypothetical protein CP556_06145 [Natrinema sp. CBA1119]
MRNSKAVGDETEARALSELIASDYSVSVPFGDNDKYDLIVDDGTDLHQIQCKTGWSNKANTMRFNTHSQTTKNGDYHEDTYHDLIDAFLVYYPDNGQFYWVDAADATEQKMEFRFESKIDHPSINWAREYEFDGTIP